MAEIPTTRASLLLRLRDRQDEAAWREFVRLYGPVVYGYARKQGLQDGDAADLCQEVFCAIAAVVERWEYDPSRGAFRNWLFTVVRRKLIDWRAALGNRIRGSGDSAIQQLLEQRPSSEGRAQWEAEWEQSLFTWASEQVRREVADSTWQAFWRTAVEGQPGKQVAAGLGLSVAAVYHARSRILARLKELVQSVQEQE
jgi:RNA polymerase sigma-70 factor (ECF subfamily)